jgi:zinc transport system substrate-binding protein
MHRTFFTLTIYAILFLFLSSESYASEKFQVFVSILPQKFFVKKVGDDLVDVIVMVEPGADAHTFEPKPQQLVALSKARIYFSIGIEFEKVWLKRFKATNPNIRVVQTDSGIKKNPMKTLYDLNYRGKEHSHRRDASHRGDHLHEFEDPHIWLSPLLVIIQAQNIRDGLIAIDPVHAPVYKANCERFIAELNNLDKELRSILGGKKDLQFMVFHPSWGYFAHTYNLKQIPVEAEGKDPKPAELQGLIRHAREHGIKIIFVQPQFSAISAKVISKAIGGQVAFVDPLAENWDENLREVARKFKAALR